MMSGKLITIEGIEGAGKSTALAFIKRYLQQVQKEIVLTREPGGTELAEKIRQLLLTPHQHEKIFPETELLLMFAARMQHIHHCIMPALAAGKWVVSDRYVDASYAYQGGGRAISQTFIQALDHHIVGECYPALTLLLDVPVAIGAERQAKRGQEKDRIEQERNDFFNNVRHAYLQRAKADPTRIKVIDATKEVANVELQIAHYLDEFLASFT